MKNLKIIFGFLIFSNCLVSCVPAIKPADLFPIAVSEPWNMVATYAAKGISSESDFRIGTDFTLDRGLIKVSVQTKDFGGRAIYSPEQRILYIGIYKDKEATKKTVCFAFVGPSRNEKYVGDAFFGTDYEIGNQIDIHDAGLCILSRVDAAIFETTNPENSKIFIHSQSLQVFKNTMLEFALDKQ